MTADEFRRIALSFPETEERAHMNHPDFRVRGKIFATLSYPDTEWGMVKLSPEQQQNYLDAAPDVFEPAPGAFGRLEHIGRGVEIVLLLFGRELHHAPLGVRVTQRRKDLTSHAEVRMVHVRALLRLGEAQGDAAKLVGSHMIVATFSSDPSSIQFNDLPCRGIQAL